MMHSASACITGASRHTGVPDHRWTCALNSGVCKSAHIANGSRAPAISWWASGAARLRPGLPRRLPPCCRVKATVPAARCGGVKVIFLGIDGMINWGGRRAGAPRFRRPPFAGAMVQSPVAVLASTQDCGQEERRLSGCSFGGERC